jgi:hypothetical protein
MSISDLILERKLPSLLSREEMKQLLLDREYGHLPDIPYTVTFSEPVKVRNGYCAKTVAHTTVQMTVTTALGSHTFPVQRILHVDGSVNPFFVLINFSSNVPDAYYPTEEIAERGFDVLTFYCGDATSDSDDFTNGLARVFLTREQAKERVCGKLMLWAWTAMRLLDYAQTLPSLDMNQAAVIGHSRLGKTALLTGMLDTRFRYVISNDSGCSGAAISSGKNGEQIADITRRFPYWFCQKYQEYVEAGIPEGFDQHYLIASIAPRFAYVGSASLDAWADPTSEFLSCEAASEAWRKMGLNGLVHQGQMPKDGERFHAGRVGYHKRYGTHFLSRHDWNHYMDYIQLHHDEVIEE